ncbi:MAG TPA: FAD-dependent oxidoreductase [Mycobacteriales bacterium]|nr:FAD-dependent oxidoreductase [Mycobacteriales bacterium]
MRRTPRRTGSSPASPCLPGYPGCARPCAHYVAGVLDDALRGLLGVRPRAVVTPRPDRPLRVPSGTSAVVVGGGIAGVSAALVLAERGVRVTLLEAAGHLGGRLGAWPRTLPDGTVQRVEHGFHGFFRQYYTWRSLLRRIDPELGFLQPLDGYPVISRSWPPEDFASLPGLPPLNLLALVAKSPSLRLRDLRSVDRVAATELLEFDRSATYAALDDVSAASFLDRLAFPDRARAVLFEVFGHSFFNREESFSAAELVAQFHFYFLANPEGLGMDVTVDDHGTCIWDPFATILSTLGVDIRVGSPVDRLERTAAGWRAGAVEAVGAVEAQHAVLALDPAALRQVVAASSGLPEGLVTEAATLTTSAPYAVARYWTDRPVRADRPVFSGVSREPTLDSISVYSRMEDGARQWAGKTGGEVLELHAYAAPDGLGAADAADRMWAELGGLWPEVAGLRVLDRETRVGLDAPGFEPGSDATRPGVRTADPTLLLAGDWVRLPFASALMERAATTGVLAANDILTRAGARAEPVSTVRPRGLLAPRKE